MKTLSMAIEKAAVNTAHKPSFRHPRQHQPLAAYDLTPPQPRIWQSCSVCSIRRSLDLPALTTKNNTPGVRRRSFLSLTSSYSSQVKLILSTQIQNIRLVLLRWQVIRQKGGGRSGVQRTPRFGAREQRFQRESTSNLTP